MSNKMSATKVAAKAGGIFIILQRKNSKLSPQITVLLCSLCLEN